MQIVRWNSNIGSLLDVFLHLALLSFLEELLDVEEVADVVDAVDVALQALWRVYAVYVAGAWYDVAVVDSIHHVQLVVDAVID